MNGSKPTLSRIFLRVLFVWVKLNSMKTKMDPWLKKDSPQKAKERQYMRGWCQERDTWLVATYYTYPWVSLWNCKKSNLKSFSLW